MVIFTALAIAATVASAVMSSQQAKGAAQASQAMADFRNKEVLKNYRHNLERLSEGRVRARQQALNTQAEVGRQHRGAIRDFQAAFSENWGQSANLFMQSLARRGGEDVEQVQQNLEQELESSREKGEDLRVALAGSFTTGQADNSGAILAGGLIKAGFQAVNSAFEMRAASRSQQVSDMRSERASLQLNLVQQQQIQFNDFLRGGPLRVSQFQSNPGTQFGVNFR